MTKEYHPEETSLKALLTVKGSTGKKIVYCDKDNDWKIIAHWHNDQWKIPKKYAHFISD